jgi:Integrase core domain.
MNKDIMMRHVDRAATMKRLVAKEITQGTAALQLGLSERQIRRIYKAYKTGGTEVLIHKNLGRISMQKTSKETQSRVIGWLKEHGTDFGSTFAQEKIKEYLGIQVSVSTIRTWRIHEGFHRPRRTSDKHKFKRRERKSYFGLMLQIDGSHHDWFENRGMRCTLLTCIDDATGKIMARFAQGESTQDLMLLMWKYIEKYGRPHMLYSDHGGPYKVNAGNPDGDKLTQLGRALSELDIKIIYANSPQAKGRVERNHSTHQDRLVKEMRLRNIFTIDEANEYLEKEYIPQFNQRFVVNPAQTKDAHRSIKGFNLNNIFCTQIERVMQNDGVIQHEKTLLQITKNRIYVKPRSKILVRTSLDGSISLWYGSIELGYEQIKSKPAIEKTPPKGIGHKVSPASYSWNKSRKENRIAPKKMDLF